MDTLTSWWNHLPENLNPVFFQLGSFQIRYYGLMYMLAFVTAYMVAAYRIKKEKVNFTLDQLDYFCLWAIVGILIGARAGYVLFYNLPYFIVHPFEIISPFSFEGGMRFVGINGLSYHGGLIGLFVSGWLFCQKYKLAFWELADFITVAAPLGYTFGRIGNFLNAELYGRVTNVPWGMYFPTAPTYHLRHPSQLYEAFLEGVVLFIVVWVLRNHHRQHGFLLGVYLIGYGLVRFGVEYFRQPDSHLGLLWLSLSMGQLMCLVMMAIGVGMVIVRGKKRA